MSHVLSRELREHTARRDIQGLRGFAVLVVVLCHAELPVPGGFIGVDVFFVISGFVISGLLIRELDRSGTIDFPRFYSRRVRRIIPALAVVVLVTLALSFLLGSPFDRQQTVTAMTAAGALLMVANGVIFLNSGGYFATPPTNNPLLNTWSLSVEEQFYLLFPALLIALCWWAGRQRAGTFLGYRGRMAVGVGLLTVASLALCVAMSFGWLRLHLSDPQWFAFYSSPTRAWEFGAGCLAYLWVSRGPVVHGRLAATVGMLGWLSLIVAVFLIRPTDDFPGWLAVVPVVATMAVLVAGTDERTWLVRVSGSAVPRWLGNVSYSWYLWHWPMIAFAALLVPGIRWVPPVAALASLGVAVVSFRVIENPIRFDASIVGRRAVALAGVCIGSVLVVSAALFVGARSFWWSPSVQSMGSQIGAQHRWQIDGCNSAVPVGQRSEECTWNSEASGAPLYLLGDSHAGQLSEAVLGAGQRLDRPIVVGTRGACPFIDTPIRVDGRIDDDCSTFVSSSLMWLTNAPDGDVVLANSVGYVTMPSLDMEDANGSWSGDSRAKQTAYLHGLARTVDQLVRAGHRVHVLLPIAGFPTTFDSPSPWYASQCSTMVALVRIAECGRDRSRANVENETAVIESGMRNAVESRGGSVFDLREQLCSPSTCATNDGEFWKYLDGTHISVGASARLAPVLARLIDG